MTPVHAFTLRLALVFSLLGLTARAHDPLDLESQARLLPDVLELRLTLASSTAQRLLTEGRSGADLTREQFDGIREELQRRAPQWLTISVQGKPLAARSVAAELSDDGDVRITLLFPRTSPQALRFDAPMLAKLPPQGYTLFILLRGPADDQAAYGRATQEKAHCEIAPEPR